jgi:hypothetical protein
MKWKKRQMRQTSRTSGQPQAARKAGPVIRIAIARGAKVVMPRLLAEPAGDEKTHRQVSARIRLGKWEFPLYIEGR